MTALQDEMTKAPIKKDNNRHSQETSVVKGPEKNG